MPQSNRPNAPIQAEAREILILRENLFIGSTPSEFDDGLARASLRSGRDLHKKYQEK